MTIDALTSTAAAPKPGEIAFPGANPNAGKGVLGVNDFMKLLTAQLTNQDPMNPMKDTEFISQMANFTSLEQTRTMAEAFSAFSAEQAVSSAASYLGKTVTVRNNQGEEVSGVVDAIVVSEGKPQVVIGGQRYETKLITAIGTLPASSPVPGGEEPGGAGGAGTPAP